MIIKYDEERHYELIRAWWLEREGTAPPATALSTYGWIYFNEVAKPLAALWLFPIMGSKLAWSGWPIANPDSSRDERHTALNTLYDIMEAEARGLGYEHIWTTSGVPPVQDRLSSRGYQTGDKMVNVYTMNLNGGRK